MKKNVPVSFTTRARLLNQLGEQLIKSEDIALLELIKNAYDADATYCHVTMENLTDPKMARIIISDDGCGMDSDTIEHVWLEIGTSNKEDLAANLDTRRTPKFKRMRLGEKGIGRFGVHRLGRKIELVSRTEKSKLEVHLSIDWTKADAVKLIEEVPVSLFEMTPEMFKGERTGTYIIVSDLKGESTRGKVRDVARAITALNSPFEDKGSFSAEIKLVGTPEEDKWLDGVVSFEDIKHLGLYSFGITMESNRITSFNYEFKPWSTMTKLVPRVVKWGDNEVQSPMQNGNKEPINLSSVGQVKFCGLVFDLDPNLKKLSGKTGLKEYLLENGGVRVYRDNMRVLNYGEPGDDWLKLNYRRMNRPGDTISSNVIIASVEVARAESSALVEKANREGFVQNKAFEQLRDAILYCIEQVEHERNVDKEHIRDEYGSGRSKAHIKITMTELRQEIDNAIKDEKAKKKIQKIIDRIEKNYQTFSSSLIKSAGAGLNLTMVIHQMEKIIGNILPMLRKRKNLEDVERQVKMLSGLVEGYSVLIRESDKKQRDLSALVIQSVFDVAFRFRTHGIALEEAYKAKGKAIAVCTQSHVINAMLNLFDNAIWWLGSAKTKEPKIYVDIDEFPQYPDSKVIVVADNGPGFTHEPVEDLVKPFITYKPYGMGIGLHLTNLIMQSLGGRLDFPAPEDVNVPKVTKWQVLRAK